MLTKRRADGAAASVHQPMAMHANRRQAAKRDGYTPDRPPNVTGQLATYRDGSVGSGGQNQFMRTTKS
ncbi:hypothetical protein [Burkholderia cepacia]|uniref:hypothetical protein n=1 Tax=Burkholderia cepacia TaxID=292 RepID=UPI001906EA40|nr:hypothetical protein [Burkholderia cepacia]MBJ9750247.1 hypothetical protein [Burkholderia cepacia]